METILEIIISLVGVLFCVGIIGGIVTWRFAHKKADAEADPTPKKEQTYIEPIANSDL